MRKQFFSIVIVFHNIMYFWLNKCSLGEHKRRLSKTSKNLTDPKLLNGNIIRDQLAYLLLALYQLHSHYRIIIIIYFNNIMMYYLYYCFKVEIYSKYSNPLDLNEYHIFKDISIDLETKASRPMYYRLWCYR